MTTDATAIAISYSNVLTGIGDLSDRIRQAGMALVPLLEAATSIEEVNRLSGEIEGLNLAHKFLHDLVKEIALDSPSQSDSVGA